MAQTNYTPIQLYYSTTAAAVPVNTNLLNGELAINITDGKLYYKDNSGTVQVIATKGAGTIGGSTTQVQYNNAGALAGSANLTFNGTTLTANTLNLTNALGATYGGTGLTSYTTGDLLYSSASNTLAKLAIGTANYILTVNSGGTNVQWSAPSSISVSTATNLAGGVAGSVPYQSGASTTVFLGIGAADRVMTSSGTAPQWVTALTGLTGVSSSSITNTSLTSGRVVYSGTGGLQTNSANLTFDGTTLTTTGVSNTGTSTIVKLLTVGNTSFNGTTVFAAATPAKLYMGTGTVTDVTSAVSATNTTGAIASLAITPIAASNTGVTYTNASTLYIAGAPSAGTNITITNPYALYVAAGTSYFAENVGIGTTSSTTRLTLSDTNSNKLTLTGGTTQNGILFNAVSTANQYYMGAGVNLLLTGDKGFLIYDTANARAKFLVEDVGGETRTLATTFLTCYTGGTERTRIDASGNLGLGVTPVSPVYALSKNIFIGQGTNLTGRTTINFTSLKTNAYEYPTTSAATFINASSAATEYYQYLGAHYWQTSTNTPTANTTITWKPAMVLHASGTLSIGNTIDYGGIMLTPPAGSYAEGLIINPASSGYSGVYLRLEGAQGASYTGNWVLGKNSSVSTGGEALNIVKESLTGGSNYRQDAVMTWATNGNTLVGFNMQIGSANSLITNGKLQVSGGKSVFSSNNASYTQFQIGNPDSGGEAGVCYISGVTAFGDSPTSVNGNNYVWAVGAGVYGIGGDSWGVGNKGTGNYVAKVAFNSTSWTFSSDERLKDLDGEITNAIDKISGLRAVYYTWKSDEAKKRKVGLIAQDVLKVLPEAVDKPEQEISEKGYTNYLGLGMSDVVPLLVAAIKEQQAIITQLQADVALLKGA